MLEAIILLGAPGCGKGTTADDLIKVSDFVHLSTGNMLRQAMAEGSAKGEQVRAYIEKGLLVADDIVMKYVRNRLNAGPPDARYIFDGFPRTLEQVRLLDELMKENNRGRVSHVFLLDVARELLVQRIEGRRICRSCGAVYHVANIQPRVEGVCDQCGGELYQRADDNRETVLNRLDVYHRQTEGLVDYYAKAGLLRTIDARDRKETVEIILNTLNGDKASK